MAVKAKPKQSCPGLVNSLQPAFVLLVVGFIYTVFVFINLLPQYNSLNGGAVSDPNVHKAGAAEFWVVCVLFHFFVFMLLVAFIRSIATPPGSVPQTDKWTVGNFDLSTEHEAFIKGVLKEPIDDEEELDMHVVERIRVSPLVERKGDLSRRTCRKCPIACYKPDRVHHCKVCGTCVLRMDHHCPWINNCVGFYNHKFFILLLVYGVLSALTVVIAMAPRTVAVILTPNAAGFWSADFLIILAWVFSFLLTIALGLFLKLHISYIRKATTTIESKEKENSNSKMKKSRLVRYRWRVANAKFNHGADKNMVHVLGPVWSWMLPIQPYSTEDGTYYDIRDYIGYRETFQKQRDGKARMLGGSQPTLC
jgi:hypothetical protein